MKKLCVVVLPQDYGSLTSSSSIGSREFLDAEQEPLRCTQQTGCYMMDDLLRVMSSANAMLPMVSGWCGASLPMPQGPRVWQQDSIHSARQNVGLWPQV